MTNNLLGNSSFEADWGDEESHRCLVFPGGEERDVDNVFTPPDWVTWFRHEAGTWDQPEVRDAWRENDSARVHDGEKGILLFTFFRNHDAGFLQQVQVEPGMRLDLSAYAHAWSNHKDGPHPDDSRWSEGAGYDIVAWSEGSQPPDGTQQQDAKSNFTFWVGIDPTGGTDPYAEGVVWSEGYHIYNGYCQQLTVEAVSETGTITVFLRSRTLWPFKHNDAYWDGVSLCETGPSPGRGQPRIQYERTYVLLPPAVGAEWVKAAADGAWNKHRYTIGGSADDAGIGDLDERNIIAVNPERWPSDLEAFFEEHYPSVEYIPVDAATPAELIAALKALDNGNGDNGNGDDPPPPEPRKTRGYIGLHTQAMVGGWREFLECKPSIFKVMSSMQDCSTVKAISPDTLVMWRHFTNNYWDTWELEPQIGAKNWVDKFRASLYEVCDEMARTIPHCPEPFIVVGGPNELVCPDRAVVQRTVNFDIAFIKELAAMGLPIAASVFTAPVGNPEPEDFDLVLQLARVAVQYGAYMDYHSYWWANQSVTGIETDWKWHAGRWEQMDDYCRSHGVKPFWLFGEMGAVGSEDGSHLNAHGGWLSKSCYNGNLDRYMADLIYWDRRIAARNKKYGNYVKGGTVFTVNEHYQNWDTFRILETETAAMAAYLYDEYPLDD